MTVSQLIEKLMEMPQDAGVYPQVVAEDGSAWNMWLEVHKVNDTMVQIALAHDELKTLKSCSIGKAL